jgi:hypothetical protein
MKMTSRLCREASNGYWDWQTRIWLHAVNAFDLEKADLDASKPEEGSTQPFLAGYARKIHLRPVQVAAQKRMFFH